MKIFNLTCTLIFSLMSIVAIIGMFYNPAYVITTIICVVMALLAFFDDSHDESVYETLKTMLNNKSSK